MINFGISYNLCDIYSMKACEIQWADLMSGLIDKWDKCVLRLKKLEDILICDELNRNLSKSFLFGLDSVYETHGYVIGEFSIAYARIAMDRPVRNSVVHYANYIHQNEEKMQTLFNDFKNFLVNADVFHHSKELLECLNKFEKNVQDLHRANIKYSMDHVSHTEVFLKKDIMKNYPEVPMIIDVNAAKTLLNRHYKRSLREIITLCLLFDGKKSQMKKITSQEKKAEDEKYDKDYISLEELVQAYDGLIRVLTEREKLLLMKDNLEEERDER